MTTMGKRHSECIPKTTQIKRRLMNITNIPNISPNLGDRFFFLVYQKEPRQSKNTKADTMIKTRNSLIIYTAIIPH